MAGNPKKKSTGIVNAAIGALAVVLAILIVWMMNLVSGIQGTARIINYAGLVRGKTQRIVKLEISGQPQDGMIADIDAGGLPLVRYNPHVIFVEPKEKQRGIRYFQQLLSIPDEDIVVFGDGMNDICMFGQGWLSIAMGNARAALKEKADYITTDVDKDGLWNACRHFGWI